MNIDYKEIRSICDNNAGLLQMNDLDTLFNEKVPDKKHSMLAEFLIKDLGIKIFDYLKTIPNYLFWRIDDLPAQINLPDVKLMGVGVFYDAHGIKEVSVPGVKVLPVGTFANSSVESVELRDGMERIDKQAFSHCQDLKKVTFPKTIKYIHPTAFEYCNPDLQLYIPESAIEDLDLGMKLTPDGEPDVTDQLTAFYLNVIRPVK